jgi:recombination protein RecA
MFSIMADASALDEVRQRLNGLVSRKQSPMEQRSLSLEWAAFDALLPDGGLPRGVVELTAPLSLGGGTMVALAAIHAAQSKDSGAWCAWIDPTRTLYAPGVVMAGVELHRLFIVRPPQSEVWRMAVKVTRAKAFAVIVIDGDSMGGGIGEDIRHGTRHRHDRSREVLVRKLALLATEGGSTILLLTDARRPHHAPLPVALRLELERTPEALRVRIGKDRYGRGGLVKTVPLQGRPSLQLEG